MSIHTNIPILGFCAWSGTGKTTLLVKLLPLLKKSGLRVGLIKHAHHNFDIDLPGKDSYELRKAGAEQVLVASSQRWALIVEQEKSAEPHLDDLLARLDQQQLDLVLVEGFKHASLPKIELHRHALNQPLLFPADASIIAVASDCELPANVRAITRLDINNELSILDFILAFLLVPK